MEVAPDLVQGRKAYAGEAWVLAYESLLAVDPSSELAASDLELLGTSAYMLDLQDYLRCLERVYRAHLDGGSPLPGYPAMEIVPARLRSSRRRRLSSR
jgi:hypothetical protein